MELIRAQDAKHFNEIVNHPSVLKWVSETSLDASDLIGDPRNVVLNSENGGVAFIWQGPGLYEIHVQVLADHRGKEAFEMMAQALTWAFTRTEALEVFARVPKHNPAVLGLTRGMFGEFEFTSSQIAGRYSEAYLVDIYTLNWNKWIRKADIPSEWSHPLADGNSTHDRYVGAALEMLRHRQPVKAVAFYNRYAIMAGHTPLLVINAEPFTAHMGNAILQQTQDGFKVVPCHG